jgi:hypothetical protein
MFHRTLAGGQTDIGRLREFVSKEEIAARFGSACVCQSYAGTLHLPPCYARCSTHFQEDLLRLLDMRLVNHLPVQGSNAACLGWVERLHDFASPQQFRFRRCERLVDQRAMRRMAGGLRFEAVNAA